MEQAPVSTPSTLLNKILIPVITTVLGATAIYFLGFNKKAANRSDMEQLLITKEATFKAWKSYVTARNISYKNVNSLSDEYGERIKNEASEKGLASIVPLMQEYKADLFREVKKEMESFEQILKNQDIDEGFVSMINRALDNDRDQEKKAKVFFDNLNKLASSDIDEKEKLVKWEKEANKFVAMGERIDERDANEAEAISETLSERYGQEFDLNDLLVYVEYKNGGKNKPAVKDDGLRVQKDPAPDDSRNDITQTDVIEEKTTNAIEPTKTYLVGEWKMKGGQLKLSKNGDMYWAFENKGYTSGTWKLTGGKLDMDAVNPDTKKTIYLLGTISNANENSFTLNFEGSPPEIYHFTRVR